MSLYTVNVTQKTRKAVLLQARYTAKTIQSGVHSTYEDMRLLYIKLSNTLCCHIWLDLIWLTTRL